MQRQYNIVDRFCCGLDQMLRALLDNPKTTQRKYPAEQTPEPTLSQDESKHAAGLMRVNHAGEICAQALYHGQSAVSRSELTRNQLQQAANEEGDHLYWCSKRLMELGSHSSYLNPIWYAGSYCIGMIAGWAGDDWSLGFVAETERQVVNHLENHLQKLPEADHKSYRVLQQMQADEQRHRYDAIDMGAEKLPGFVQQCMSFVSKIMVKTAYWV